MAEPALWLAKNFQKVAKSPTGAAMSLTATTIVRVGLKMTVVVGGVDLGSRIGQRCLTGARKCLKSDASGRKPTIKNTSSEANTATLASMVVPGW